MRLRPEKIQELAELVYAALSQNGEVELRGEREDVVLLIGRCISEDLEAEDQIEADARKILEQHKDEMRRMGISEPQMLRKTMEKLARDRKVVL